MNREDELQSFAAGAECVVVIEASSGDARVEGWREARVEVESAGREARVQQEGATFRIHPRPAGSGDVKVRAPQNSNVVLRSISGNLSVDGIAGEVTIQSTSGDVRIQRVRGSLKVHTVSGDLRVRQSELNSASIDTVSGDMEVETTLDPQGEYHARGVSGDLKLWLPAGQKCTIYSTSLSGDFDSDLPHEIVEQSRRHLEVRINGGGTAFHVRSTSGDISVRALKEAETEKEAAATEERQVPRAGTGAQPSQPTPSAAPRETQPLPTQGVASTEPFAVEEQQVPRAGTAEGQRQAWPSGVAHETRPLPLRDAASVEPFAVEDRQVPRAGTEGTPSGAGGAPAPSTPSASQRMQILKDIEEGRISVSDGLAKLRALD